MNISSEASTSVSNNDSDPMEYPDPAGFNLNDTHDQLVFMHKYEDAQQHDPSVKYAVVIFYFILLTVIAAQSGLVVWRTRHKRSYELATLLGLWLVPVTISVYFHFWRFVSVWALFTAMTGYILHTCASKHIDRTTPRKVYSYFLGVYKVSVAVGVAGYALVILEIAGGGVFLRSVFTQLFPFQLLWYGLYFGVLGRDCAEVAADRMAATLGMRKRMAVSTRACGICSGELRDFGAVASAGEAAQAGQPGPSWAAAGLPKPWGADSTAQLQCKHCFHNQCIRGWTIVGKKDTCPVCLEKVDLRVIFAGRPWETRNLTWMQMLDSLRYLIVWNPLILICMHFVLHYIGFERFSKHKGDKEALAIMTNATLRHLYEEEDAIQQGVNMTYSLRL